jgi:hypothetical protein
LAGDLARRNNKSPKGVWFPFADSQQALDTAIIDKNFDRAGPEAVALLKTFEPYRGADNPLRDIHDLDIIDKHRMLVPLADMIGAEDLPGKNEWTRGLAIGPIRDGASFALSADHTHFPIGHRARGA